ncbi:metal ABC transporter solute-binding protein, Zn/Mn family [Subtercola vilae]|uniref:ABC transporter substrate-binding protein n=1 Tax=Subtercola vilae TaxID=2056433 RepID=A0A4T2CBC4_9MICO|nr:zinc ABC transporter substrate-binding protein [Subtercola vilae]TIH40912.1 ABC transporter substrate-binding protein [Subtercola vilae]
MRLTRFTTLATITSIAALTSLALSGCSTSTSASGTGATSGSAGTPIAIVASTDVYGDIAAQIGGDKVSVTSIIDDPSKDPHEYAADARNQLSLSKAAIVIENGAGYDDFVDTMLQSANNPTAKVLNAADISGYDQKPADGEFNEHLWYDFPTVQKVVDSLAATLGALDAADAPTFTANADAYKQKLTALEATEADMKVSFAGRGAAITEPVPLYMLQAIGLVDKTPGAFSTAIENGTDVAPDVLASTLALFSDKQVSVLAYNEQTSGAQTEAVLNAATAAKIAVVPVTETLPSGSSYIGWMTDNLAALKTALSQ